MKNWTIKRTVDEVYAVVTEDDEGEQEAKEKIKDRLGKPDMVIEHLIKAKEGCKVK